MDDPDAQMQTEASSQTGSIAHSDRMELENDDLHTSVGALPDADMDIPAEEMRDALIEDDEEMAAEMEEQEMKTEIQEGWGDRDADIEVVDVEQANVAHADADVDGREMKEAKDTEHAKEAQDMLQTGLEEGAVAEATEATQVGHSVEHAAPSANNELEQGQTTLEQTATATAGHATDAAPQDKPEQAEGRDSQANEIEPVQYDVLNPEGEDKGEKTAPDEEKEVADVLKPENETDGEEERYADVPVETNDPVAEQNAEAAVANTEGSAQRPSLQKDYLSHIDLFSSQPAHAPHVSLIYDNSSYSLFRPSSSPSGDDEDLLFENEEAGDHELYFGTLEQLTQRLHAGFPALRGDGENEIVLDFGILDMQISEDNIYIKQLSLFDIDRIRVGMSQPELDRLQINLLVGKRFVYRFNELAEHCYRMYTGSEEDDSGTIQDYDEQENEDDPLQDYNEDEVEAESEAQVNPDYTTEENTQDLDADELEKLHGQEQEHEGNAENGDGEYEGENGEDIEEQEEGEEELHPPSDEHYEDPEFSQEIVDDDDQAVNDTEEGRTEGDDKAAQEEEVVEEAEEAGEKLDLDAPLAEAAEQAEEDEEAVFEEEEGAQAEGEADANTAEAVTLHDPAVSRATHQPDRTEQEAQYYESLDSLAGDEEVVLVEKPDPAPALAQYEVELEDTRAAQAGDIADNGKNETEEANGNIDSGGVEEMGKKITRSSSKRNRADLLGGVDQAELDQDLPEQDTQSGDSKRAKISVNI